MNQVELCQLLLNIKEVKLSITFPCKMTFHHAGKILTSEIQSDVANTFLINKDITIQEETSKEYAQIEIHLANGIGAIVRAGTIKINLKDIYSSQGQVITLNLQKCLLPYASCTLHIKSVKFNKSLIKTTSFVQIKNTLKKIDNSIIYLAQHKEFAKCNQLKGLKAQVQKMMSDYLANPTTNTHLLEKIDAKINQMKSLQI